ncbi:MAG TPA: pyridoxal phosphate-dependent aminotransferase family protein [Chitinophagaceae bacterium]|nr:pyridoxal phosphate-dependent aminotransferase family protein [Chitinophagaceae bacterium]
MDESFLDKKTDERKQAGALRRLTANNGKTDFCSNDYLGIVKNKLIEKIIPGDLSHGSTGSRLLSGNYRLIEETEEAIASFHESPAALIFNSGYDANTGILSCVPQKGDAILYDQLSHASIRDGIRLSFAAAFSFLHNDAADLEKKLSVARESSQNIFVVTESVFSMDGDRAPLAAMVPVCKKYNAALITDEAHATGVTGERGEGLVQHLGLQKDCFARIHTFGKACGCHGAAIAGSEKLKQYLVNFSRQFIYSTALPESAAAAIAASYKIFPSLKKERAYIQKLTALFQNTAIRYEKLKSDTPIQVVVIPGNEEVKKIAGVLQENKIDVRPILYPTVPKGKERLRIVLHAFNTEEELYKLLALLS